ncbi:hypothetical protein WJX72_001341 [[Myrmecia] bisecta]|uniref:SWIM-type domain-containing protein n=1 Tax=[Myrmecia] bisecta TaxID=41462 RepID=A0AAW1PVL2_9CHLO
MAPKQVERGEASATGFEPSTSAPEPGLNAYEKQRAELIARNRARLLALGIPAAADALAATVQLPKKQKKARVKKEPQAPTRASARLQHESPQSPEDVASELALCMIDGECPRCGKVMERGHQAHLARCSAVRQPKAEAAEDEEEEELDEATTLAEIQAEQEERKKRQKAKLRELEMSGLIDFNDEHAVFVVLGSTGTHYKVTLSEEAKAACQCMDFRIRRRICKHQRLVLGQLGLPEDSPKGWRQAVADQMDTLVEEAHDHGLDSEVPAPPKKKVKQGRKAAPRAAKATKAEHTSDPKPEAEAPAPTGISDLARLRRGRPGRATAEGEGEKVEAADAAGKTGVSATGISDLARQRRAAVA